MQNEIFRGSRTESQIELAAIKDIETTEKQLDIEMKTSRKEEAYLLFHYFMNIEFN